VNARAIKRRAVSGNHREIELLRRSEGMAIASGQRKAAAAAEQEETAGIGLVKKLHGEDAIASTWKYPLITASVVLLVLYAVLIAIVVYFNSATWALPLWALLLVGVGTPIAIIAAKVGDTIATLGDDSALRNVLDNAKAAAKRSCAAFVVLGLAFALLKTLGQIPEAFALLVLGALEGALAFLVAAYTTQALVLLKPGLYFRGAAEATAKSNDLATAISVLETHEGQGGMASNGSGGQRTYSRGQSSVTRTLLPIVVLFLALGASTPRASTAAAVLTTEGRPVAVTVAVDQTISVSAPERLARTVVVAEKVTRCVATLQLAVRLQLVAFDGSPESSRVAAAYWDLDSLSVPLCWSPFPTRCDYLKQQAFAQMTASRDPKLSQARIAIRNAARTAPSARETCLFSCLSDAQASWRSVVITDARSNCDQADFGNHAGRDHVLVVVVGSPSDGAKMQERITARVAMLRSKGYRAIDGSTVLSFDWEGFFKVGAQ